MYTECIVQGYMFIFAFCFQAKVDRLSSLVDTVQASLKQSEQSTRLGCLTEFKQCLTVYAVTQVWLVSNELNGFAIMTCLVDGASNSAAATLDTG
jgi:hypothetical protein